MFEIGVAVFVVSVLFYDEEGSGGEEEVFGEDVLGSVVPEGVDVSYVFSV